MKTKFTQLVKLKKQQLNEIEIELVTINNKIASLKDEINKINEAIKSISKPSKGTFRELNSTQEAFHSYMFEIEELNKRVESLILKRNQVELKMKELYVEYEKFKYLEATEIKKILKEQKRKEEEELNEISVMLYNNKEEEQI